MNKQNVLPIVIAVVALILLTICVLFTAAYAAQTVRERAGALPDGSPAQETTPEKKESETSVAPSSPSGEETESGTTPESKPSDDQPPAWLLTQTADAGQSYIDGLTFLGDSTTFGMIKAGVLKDKENTHQVWYGPHGTLTLPAATSHLLNDGTYAAGKKLSEIAADKQPKILVITLGVGVSNTITEEQFKASYGAAIDTVLKSSPSTRIICNSIYPVCKERDSYKLLNNPDIIKCNNWLKDVVAEKAGAGKAVYYLDSYGILCASDGFMPAMYSNGDGLHLSASAFNAVLNHLRTHALPD